MPKKFIYILPVCLLLAFFWQVPFTDYAYLDEAHQLWHNKDRSNFVMFANQGRFITGWIINSFFDKAETIDGLKYLRIFSLIGWCLSVLLWQYLIHKWNKYLLLPEPVVNFSGIFLACSLPVAIYIGWASCLEVFIGFIAAILSGHLLFVYVADQNERVSISLLRILGTVFLGVISLFVYQNCFGCFLLPFVYYFFFVSKKVDKKLIIGVAFYLIITGIYFIAFKYSLDYFQLEASDRTGLKIEPLKKLSFFVSHPLAMAFSFNFLYNYHGIFSQAFYPVCALVLILSTYLLNKKAVITIRVIVIVLVIALLMYIPGLVVSENFASYRTMLALSLLIPVLVFRNVYNLIKKVKDRRQFAIAFVTIIILVAYYNFNFQFVNPLKYEYEKLRARLNLENWQKADTVFFMRPYEKAFSKSHGVKVYKDEFGLPSTFKDWAPDPLIRQVCRENTGSREKAEKLMIIQKVSGDSAWYNTGDNPVIYGDTILKRN